MSYGLVAWGVAWFIYLFIYFFIYLFFSLLGTNNARLAGMLRQLALYYHKDANNLFMVRIAQVNKDYNLIC